jgi:organic radical activating enzyme
MISYSEIKKSHLGIDFYLSKSCNKSCHYCTAWTLEMRNLDVDMDFLDNTLKYLSPYKTRINLLGGEPGLIKNLDEVIHRIKSYDNLVCSVLSNSFVRKRYPWVLEDPDILYMEHLVLDFYEDRIEKLGNYNFFEENNNSNYNVIIMTPNYFEYRKNHDLSILDHKNTEFKHFNSRAPGWLKTDQEPEIIRRACAAFPSVPVIDFELQKIRHCSKKVISGSRLFDVTNENIDKMMNYQLFEFEDYCRKCTETLGNPGEAKIEKIKNSGAPAIWGTLC